MSASAKAEKTEHESEANHTILSTDFFLPTVTELKTELEDVPSISVIPVSWDYFLKKPDLEEHSIVSPKNDIKMENDDDLPFNGFHRSDTTAGHPQDVAVKQEVEEEGKFGDASCELLNLPRVTKIEVELTFENGSDSFTLPSSFPGDNSDTCESVHDSDSSYVEENNSDAESENSDVETKKTATIVGGVLPQTSKTLKSEMGVSKYLKVMKYYIVRYIIT